MSAVKYCLWCGLIILKGRKSKAEYAAAKLHRHCVMSYRHHGCAKQDVPEVDPKDCRSCGVLLVRRSGENLQAWRKRQTCNKSCAASSRKKRTKIAVDALQDRDIQARSGCRTYRPGSPEFAKIAALYGG